MIPVTPRKRPFQWGVIHGALVVALLLHLVSLSAWLVLFPHEVEENLRILAEVDVVDSIVRSEPQALKPPELRPPKPPPPPEKKIAAPAPEPPSPPRAPEKAGPPRPTARPGPPPLALKQDYPRAPVRRGKGEQMVTRDSKGSLRGTPGGDPRGTPGGTGSGEGGRGTGSGGQGPGGQGKARGVATWSITHYNNAEVVGVPEDHPGIHRTGGAPDWEAVCRILGIDYQQLREREVVRPFFLGVRNPTLEEQQTLGGQVGDVWVVSRIDARGKVYEVTISRSSGAPVLDEMAKRLAYDTLWLPALRHGQPAPAKVEYRIEFGSSETRPY